MSDYDQYVRALRHARITALEETRSEERIAAANLPERCRIKDMVAAWCIDKETVRRRLERGEIRGAYIDQGRWAIRRADLLAYSRFLSNAIARVPANKIDEEVI